MDYIVFKASFGMVKISEKNGKIFSLEIVSHLKAFNSKLPLLNEAKKQLNLYLNGQLKQFNLLLEIVTSDFTKKVLQQLVKIPPGETIPYQELAKKCGNGKVQQAAASVCAMNKIPIFIPCHCVIHKNGQIWQYLYGKPIKCLLLKLEKND